jgi:integrase
MKIGDVTNIWEPVEELSGRDKGSIYAQRAHQLVGEALSDPVQHKELFVGGRIRRSLLADRIGCHRSALRDNPQIQRLLDEVEGRSSSESGDAARGEHKFDPAPPPVLPIVEWLKNQLAEGCRISGRASKDRIVVTDQSCRIGTIRYDIPTIVWSDGIELAASDWLRHLVVTNALETSTVGQYAKIMRAFLRHCQAKRRDWFSVDDEFLRAWRDGRRGKVDDLQVISDLNIVFQFYVWAEETELLSYHVCAYDKMPEGRSRRDFPISARRRKSAKGTTTGWASTLTFRASKAIEGRRNTPTNEQVISVHEQLLKATHGERDALIAAWAEESAGRLSELLQVRKRDLPSKEELERLLSNEEDAEIHIGHRKRRSKAPLSANPFLLISTIEWVEGGRKKIVDGCRKKHVGYREPDELFISSTTGKVLDADSVTKIMSAAFKNAGVKKASLHRLRAKAIVTLLESLVDSYLEMNIVVEPGSQWAETVLIKAAEMAGHASPMSLRPYLNFVLARRMSLTDAARRARKAAEIRDQERRAAAAKASLEQTSEIAAAMKLLRSGKAEAAGEVLRQFIERESSAQSEGATASAGTM